MQNKPGIINSYIFYEVKKTIIKTKLSLLDENFTFNLNEFNFDYLIRLHLYLFSDFYDFDFKDSSDFSKEISDEINDIMSCVENICSITPDNKELILDYLHKIWEVQAFLDGNTRTVLGLLKVLNSAYNLGFQIDLDKEIPNFFSDFKDRMCLVYETRYDEQKLSLKH